VRGDDGFRTEQTGQGGKDQIVALQGGRRSESAAAATITVRRVDARSETHQTSRADQYPIARAHSHLVVQAGEALNAAPDDSAGFFVRQVGGFRDCRNITEVMSAFQRTIQSSRKSEGEGSGTNCELSRHGISLSCCLSCGCSEVGDAGALSD
jgi:hypothetical protein